MTQRNRVYNPCSFCGRSVTVDNQSVALIEGRIRAMSLLTCPTKGCAGNYAERCELTVLDGFERKGARLVPHWIEVSDEPGNGVSDAQSALYAAGFCFYEGAPVAMTLEEFEENQEALKKAAGRPRMSEGKKK